MNVLSIAGSDPLGGAGIQGDLKTMAALGVYGLSALTAVTAQNSKVVSRIACLSSEVLKEQLSSIISDVPVHAVKIGMVYSTPHIKIIREFIKNNSIPYVVIDPIFRSTTGQCLIENEGRQEMIKQLFPLASIITPNIEEASYLIGKSIYTLDDAINAGQDILKYGSKYVLIKGGHLDECVTDTLIGREKVKAFKGTQITRCHTHGTGCALSTAIACYLADGYEMEKAVEKSKAYVFGAIEHGESIGNTYGPINHFWKTRNREM